MLQPASQTQKAKGRRSGLGLAIVGVIIPAAVFIFVGGGQGCSGSVEGDIRSVGQPFGDYVIQPTSCFSGEHESFFGVWVAPDLSEDENGRSGFKGGLKLVRSHTGQWEVYVESPHECRSFDCTIRQLDPEYCNTFSVEVRNTSSTVNDIRVREGHADLQCQLPEGGSFAAHLVFDGCS